MKKLLMRLIWAFIIFCDFFKNKQKIAIFFISRLYGEKCAHLTMMTLLNLFFTIHHCKCFNPFFIIPAILSRDTQNDFQVNP